MTRCWTPVGRAAVLTLGPAQPQQEVHAQTQHLRGRTGLVAGAGVRHSLQGQQPLRMCPLGQRLWSRQGARGEWQGGGALAAVQAVRLLTSSRSSPQTGGQQAAGQVLTACRHRLQLNLVLQPLPCPTFCNDFLTCRLNAGLGNTTVHVEVLGSDWVISQVSPGTSSCD